MMYVAPMNLSINRYSSCCCCCFYFWIVCCSSLCFAFVCIAAAAAAACKKAIIIPFDCPADFEMRCGKKNIPKKIRVHLSFSPRCMDGIIVFKKCLEYYLKICTGVLLLWGYISTYESTLGGL